MNTKSIFSLVLGSAIAVGLSTNAWAFHSGGVAECDGCHTMHNSKNGAAMSIDGNLDYTSNAYLLQGSDQSSTCLNCHGVTSIGSYHIFAQGAPAGSGALNMTPGGDFAWLQKTFNWTVRGSPATEDGETHGHNIIAADFGLVADSRFTTAPGGTYDATRLSCISCHDPHGRYRILSTGGIATTGEPIWSSGSYGAMPKTVAANGTPAAVGVYRILGGIGYAPLSYPDLPFANTVPTAIVPSTYNRPENANDTRVAYGTGMSEWCANCHSNMHNANYPGTLRHPAASTELLGGVITANYNTYVKSGDMTGAPATAYNSIVPFEEGTGDRAVLAPHANNNGSYRDGPGATANVMCLSCHRAHATGFESMMRWNMDIELLTANGYFPGSDSIDTEAAQGKFAMGRTVAETMAAYNLDGSTGQIVTGKFATYQRSLCNKCHAKD